jgi:EAL domain-containing protein (putative c-di-GMP-specific phosphodiesterase class I)
VSKSIIGSEALVRLVKDGKIVPAKDFIDVAEKYQFTVPLDKYVLIETCKYIKELKSKKIKFNCISVNISRNTLCDDNMLVYYTNILNQYDIKKNEIEFEVTERDSSESIDLSDTIHELSKKFNVSIDDFGTGLSSLSMLSESRIKTIKIDRKFVVDKSESTRKILDNIIKLASSLGFDIVAEGVETKEQVDYLKKKGCNIIQGYYFYEPMSFEEFVKVLEGEK